MDEMKALEIVCERCAKSVQVSIVVYLNEEQKNISFSLERASLPETKQVRIHQGLLKGKAALRRTIEHVYGDIADRSMEQIHARLSLNVKAMIADTLERHVHEHAEAMAERVFKERLQLAERANTYTQASMAQHAKYIAQACSLDVACLMMNVAEEYAAAKALHETPEYEYVIVDGIRIVKPSAGGGGGTRGGGAGGGVAKKPIDGALLDKNGFPVQSALEAANIKLFDGGINSAGTAVIDGKKFFVKQSDYGTAANEPLAYQIGKDHFGLEKNLVPVQLMKKNGGDRLVSPWVGGKTFAQIGPGVNDAVAKLPVDEYTKMHLFQYVVGNSDAHSGNIMYDAATKTVRPIDMGYTFGYSQYHPGRSALDTARAGSGFANHNALSPAIVKSVAKQSASIVAAAKAGGISGTKLVALRDRMTSIKKLSRMDNPTVGMLQEVQ
jgi:hypothetical protein